MHLLQNVAIICKLHIKTNIFDFKKKISQKIYVDKIFNFFKNEEFDYNNSIKLVDLSPKKLQEMKTDLAIKAEPNDNLDKDAKIISVENSDPFEDTNNFNPWEVESIQAFSYFRCPECTFDSKEDTLFQDHAISNHPLSFVLFGSRSKIEDFKIKDEMFETSLIEEKNEGYREFKTLTFDKSEIIVEKVHANGDYEFAEHSIEENEGLESEPITKKQLKSKRYREKLSLTSTVRVCPQPNCDFSTKSLQNYNYHIDTRHPETVEKKFFCDQCNKGFASESTIKMHKSRNHQNRYLYGLTRPQIFGLAHSLVGLKPRSPGIP